MDYYFIGNDDIFNEDIQRTTLDEAFLYLKDKEIISIDIETTRKFGGTLNPQEEGLDPYLSKIVMFQIGDENKQFVIDYRFVDISIFKPLLEDENIIIVGQNLKFEYKHLLHNNNIKINNIYDTMLVERILYNGLKPDCSLKALNRKYLNVEVDKDTRLEFLSINSKPFTKKQIEYGAEDILYPILIRKKQLSLIKQKNLKRTVDLEMKFLPVLGDTEYKGMNVNKVKWKELYNKNLQIFNELKDQLDDFILTNLRDSPFINNQLTLFSDEISTNIKWTSSHQVVKVFKYLDICPQAVSTSTKKLSYTVNADVLRASLKTTNKDISQEYLELIKLYLKFKEYEQATTTFGIKWLDYVNPITNRVHSNFNQLVDTGRISSRNPNMQQLPNKADFRECFDVLEGFKMINADYSSQETVLLANIANEKNQLELIRNGGCLHCFVTKALYPDLKDLTDKEIKAKHADKRQISKAAGFATNYGGTGYTIAQNLGISEEEGDVVYNAYFKAFPDLKKYFEYVQNKTLKQGYILIDSITGRKRFYIPPKSPKEKGAILRKALNAPIQGSAGSMTKLAGILIRKELMDKGLENDIFIINFVHDEILMECPTEFSEEAAEILQRNMEKAGEYWCRLQPIKADAVISTYWNH